MSMVTTKFIRIGICLQNYLFCVEMKRDYDWEAKENEFFKKSRNHPVYITNLNQGEQIIGRHWREVTFK